MKDGICLYSAKHPRPKFLKRILNHLLLFFIRPKLSEEAIGIIDNTKLTKNV